MKEMDKLKKRPPRTMERFNPSTPGVSEDQGHYSLPHLGPIFNIPGGVTGDDELRLVVVNCNNL